MGRNADAIAARFEVKKRVLFRCDASPEIGGGHVMRCLTLADVLRARGWNCGFVCNEDAPRVVPALSQSGYKIHADPVPCDVLVVDHYGLDFAYERDARSLASLIVVFDDLANRPHDCDILMDQTYGRSAEDYRLYVRDGCRILCGAQYALLRPQFAEIREKSLRRRREAQGTIQRLLVMFGTTDPNNMTGRALQSLESLAKRFDIDVVLGPYAPALESVREVCAASRHQVSLHVGIYDVASLMLDADLAIGAGGTTNWERCCLGLPTLVVEIADNQKMIAEQLHMVEAVINMGWFEHLSEESIPHTILQLCENPEKLKKMGAMAAKICDGSGAFQLADAITAL